MNSRPQRQIKIVKRFIDEQPKYTKGIYHGRRDCWDRGYNGEDYYMNNEDSEDEYELRRNLEDDDFIDNSENISDDNKDILLNMYTVFKKEVSDSDDTDEEELDLLSDSETEFEDDETEEDESEYESQSDSEEDDDDESEEDDE